MTFLYLGALLVSLGCIALLDWRFRLFLWRDPRRAALVLVIGVAFFAAWDLLGIGWGVFRRGDAVILTGLQLAPEFPIEELVFLTFLCYLTMLLVLGAARLLAARRRE